MYTHIDQSSIVSFTSIIIHFCSNYRMSVDVDIMYQNSKIPNQQHSS